MQIKYLNGANAGKTVEIQPPGVSIGRETDNDIQLLVGGVSRYHAKIAFDGFVWKVTDTGSTNGTFINGQIIREAQKINPGDILELGEQKILFGEAGFGAGVTPVVEEDSDAVRTQRSIPRPSERTTNNPFPTPPPAAPAPQKKEQEKEPEKEKQKEEKPGADSILKTIRTKQGIFNGKKAPAEKQAKETPEGKNPLFSGKHGNFLFALIVICIGLVSIAAYIKFFAESNKANSSAAKKTVIKPGFLLVYEKIEITRDNIFRFALRVEDGKAEISLDDLKHQRHPHRKIEKLSENSLSQLENAVRETGFMKLREETNNATKTDFEFKRKLLISLDGEFNNILVTTKYAPTSFQNVEQAVNAFAEEYGFRIDSMSVEQIMKEAANSFALAERLFNNWKAVPSNLRDSIKHYKLAIEYLEQFDPKPEEWETARKHLEEANKIYVLERKNLEFQIQRYSKLKQYDKARDACSKAMDLLEPGSRGYLQAKRLKIIFERELKKR